MNVIIDIDIDTDIVQLCPFPKQLHFRNVALTVNSPINYSNLCLSECKKAGIVIGTSLTNYALCSH